MERSLWDGCCLYEYAILENQNNPALVICDLSDSPERGRHEKYQEVRYNLDHVIAEIGCALEQDLTGMVAICRKGNGAYFGIDLLGENRKTFLLSQEKAITAEAEAVSIATELHIMRTQQLDKIMSSLPTGRIVQYSEVVISCYGGSGISFFMSGYPDNKEITKHPAYIRLMADNPEVKSCYMEVTSYKISRAASPISLPLLNEIIKFGSDVFRNQSIVELGDARNQVLYTQYQL